MAYLHCDNCFWCQDDFWDEDYNPITYLETNYKNNLLCDDLDDIIEIQRFTKKRKAYMKKTTLREYLACELERQAQKIRRMEYRTREEFEKDKHKECPWCGKSVFKID